MANNYSIRLITEDDAEDALAIYRYYVTHTIISFEYEAPSLEEFIARIRTNTADFPWLVCLRNNKIVGYAYASKHRYRTAYQWSPESTVYVSPEEHSKGIARVLYETLFSLLQLQGYFNVYAGVALPNDKSIGFHRALGFEEIGIFKKIGYKHGNWHDTHWFQRTLTAHITEPPAPKKLLEAATTDTFKTIISNANIRLRNINASAT